jgi:Schlafen, AlbA_2
VADADRFLPRATEAKRESKYVEFKEEFDPATDGEWLELIKDIVAIANIGGGVIVIGLRNDGSLSGANMQAVLALDGAAICDKLRSYLGGDFDDFEISAVRRNGGRVAAMVIGPAEEAPLTFVRPGTYPDPQRPDRQKSAFGRGPYFRHGAKSEPATRDDLREFIERRLDAVRQKWLGGIRRVVTAPEGSEIAAIERSEDDEGERAIRVTTDENAPLYRAVDWDVTHPYRQTELVPRVSERLPDDVTFNSHDLLSVRRAHDIDHKTRPDFVHLPRFGWYQYSEAFVEWLVEQYNRDHEFFDKARDRYYELTH